MSANTVIGICGGSGSGKTSFIRKLRTIFNEEQICIISQDDYYKPLEEQEIDEKGVENFDLPKSIDHLELASDILKLKSGKSISRKEYIFNNDKSIAKKIELHPAPIVIVEGLFVLHFEEVQELLNYSLFIEAKENLKVIRRIKRDQIERNYPLEDVLYRYEFHVMESFEKYIEPYKEMVDIIINNNVSFDKGFEIIAGFIKNRLVTE